MKVLKGMGTLSDIYDAGEAIVEAWNKPTFKNVTKAVLKTTWTVISNSPIVKPFAVAIDVLDGVADLLDWW